MKILLISPSYSPIRNADYFPLGIAFLASFCTQHGHDVRVINLNNHDSWEHERIIHNELAASSPDIVGTGGLTGAFLELEKICQYIRGKSKLPIILGGGGFSSEPELMMRELPVEYGIAGEGELILSNLLDALDHGGPVPAGVWHREAGQVRFRGKGPVVADLDILPEPDIESLGIEDFLQIKENRPYSPHLLRIDIDRDRMIPISASRSCPYRCTFCYHAGLGSYRQMSVAKLISLIRQYQQRYDTNQFAIYDELFASQRDRIVEFCSKLYAERLDIMWGCQLRVDSIDPQLLSMMKDSGCAYVSYGIESGSEKILQSMNKKITTRQVADAIQMTRAAKMGFQANFLYGDPAETGETVEQALEFQKKHELYFVDWSAVIPYPGSTLYLESVKRGKIKDKIAFIRSLCNQSKYLWHDKINMTGMDDEEFHAKYLALRELNDQNHRRRLAILVSSEVVAQCTSHMEVECPSCHSRLSFHLTYPPPAGDSFNIKSLVGITGVNVLCPECYRKMHIKSQDIAHIQPLYQHFQAKIDSLKHTARPVVCMPAMDRLYESFSQDIDLSGLSVAAILDSRPNHLGREFMNCHVEELSPESIGAYSACIFIIFPWIEYQKALHLLQEQGISAEDILCWNEMFRVLQ